jgi:hypothetical protein
VNKIGDVPESSAVLGMSGGASGQLMTATEVRAVAVIRFHGHVDRGHETNGN